MLCSGGTVWVKVLKTEQECLLHSTLNPQPESVPINALVAVEGNLWKKRTG
jgi:hypothetical protein